MTDKYRIRALTQTDLEAIWLYTYEEWGVLQADMYLKALLHRFDWLAEHPALGKPRDDVKLGYYCFPEGMHLVFYKLSEDCVEIIGIPHQRMDIVEYLKQE